MSLLKRRKGRAAPSSRRRSSLTLRILTVNFIAPLVLMMGLMYMSQYRDNLIRAELGTLKAQAQLFAGAIAEGAVKPAERGRPFLFAKPEEFETLVPELSRRMVRRLGENTDSRTRLFSKHGRMMADSYQLVGPGDLADAAGQVQAHEWFAMRGLRWLSRVAVDILPRKARLNPYPDSTTQRIEGYPDALSSMKGRVTATAWKDRHGRILLTAAAPILKTGQVMGVVLLTREAHEIERAMGLVRFDVAMVFLGALSVTIVLSMYLAGVLGRPLKKLARAAEAVRLGQGQGQGRMVDIPDFSWRNDEIGELSEAMRGMTTALWERMDTIERFAADVSHELKNPLTSLRSAVETVDVVKTKKDRNRLMDIIKHDVQRMDRLISDISNASRLDSELLRDEMGDVNLNMLLLKLADAHRMPLIHGRGDGDMDMDVDSVIKLNLPQDNDAMVRGNEGRLAQVFDNLMTNALSFSPPARPVVVTAIPDAGLMSVMIDDDGPGIPENKLEAIFERFYTERPSHEDYGRHSGLGLSIARQIVRAHGGAIWAENRHDPDGGVLGARFTVTLTPIS